nr:MAG TPA: hypothetical protein [Caudoviricetes sp.]
MGMHLGHAHLSFVRMAFPMLAPVHSQTGRC